MYNIITKFHLFELANISDLSPDVKYYNLENNKGFTVKKFQDDSKLVKSVNKTETDDIIFNIKYNDKKNHSIKDKIKKRTPLHSISDFNKLLGDGLLDFIKSTNDMLILNNLNEPNFVIHYNEYKFNVLFTVRNMNSRLYYEKNTTFYNIYINSVLPNSSINNTKKIHYTDVLL